MIHTQGNGPCDSLIYELWKERPKVWPVLRCPHKAAPPPPPPPGPAAPNIISGMDGCGAGGGHQRAVGAVCCRVTSDPRVISRTLHSSRILSNTRLQRAQPRSQVKNKIIITEDIGKATQMSWRDSSQLSVRCGKVCPGEIVGRGPGGGGGESSQCRLLNRLP